MCALDPASEVPPFAPPLSYEDHQMAKQSTGLDAGQVIRWGSWHRWTAICLLATSTSPSPPPCNASKRPAKTWTPD